MDSNPNTTAQPMPSAAATSVLMPFPTPTIAEAENHIIPAANPSPTAPPAPHHPPYADMICTAISALNEMNGSSRQAIAKYIEQVYTGLPATHSAMLTHNLKRLKNSGLLVLVKKSYKLARSDATALPTSNVNVHLDSLLHNAPPSRGRGRPPKNKTLQPQFTQIPQHQQLQFQQSQSQIPAQPQQIQQPFMAQPQFQLQLQQPDQHQFTVTNSHQQYADPVLVALGLVDEPSTVVQKKGRGRPRKNPAGPVDGTGQVVSISVSKRRGRPPGSRAKPWLPRRSGRPPKPKSVSSISNGFKRSRGRPRKVQPPIAPTQNEAPQNGVSLPSNHEASGQVAAPPPVDGVPNVNASRSRGRPRKNPSAVVPVVSAGFMFGASGRAGRGGGGRGRGRGRGGLQYLGYMRTKTSSGRPVGRPRKFPAPERSATSVTTEELSIKLEQFQSKVKEAVSALKPYFTDESPFAATNAFKELESLVMMDFSAPLNDDALITPPLAPPPPQPESQVELYPNHQHVPQSQPPLQEVSMQQASSQPQVIWQN